LEVLTPRIDLDAFFARIASAPERVLMLDYDGTLAPFHIDPSRAVPYPQARAALDRVLEAACTRVVIVSGRPARELPPLLALHRQPEIFGAHGWERLLPDGTLKAQDPEPSVRQALSAAEAHAHALGGEGRVEVKRASVALHWRGAPAPAAADLRERALARWEPLAQDGAVELLPFDGGIELRAVGCNKHYAVKAVLSEMPDGSAAAYLGDDLTDEDAFRAVKPRGLGVLVRQEFRPTGADVWIRPPQELVEFIERWCVA
jgi:trehalose-phosphatase